MNEESQQVDRKSLRKVTGKTADFHELANDCVCFANASGGELLVGLEDDEAQPQPTQRIDHALLDQIRKRVAELTVNVQVAPEIRRADNGGEIIAIRVAHSTGVASTVDGRYYLRVGDSCRPVVGDDVMRLLTDRPAVSWEAMISLSVPRGAADPAKLKAWMEGLQASERVKASVKEKSADELLEHYGFVRDRFLTHLGILLIGTAVDRMRLGSAPIVQAIRYDERGVKVGKYVWDDHSLSPIVSAAI